MHLEDFKKDGAKKTLALFKNVPSKNGNSASTSPSVKWRWLLCQSQIHIMSMIKARTKVAA